MEEKMSFAKWLEVEKGLDWGYVDNNYSGEAYNELWNEYEEYLDEDKLFYGFATVLVDNPAGVISKSSNKGKLGYIIDTRINDSGTKEYLLNDGFTYIREELAPATFDEVIKAMQHVMTHVSDLVDIKEEEE